MRTRMVRMAGVCGFAAALALAMAGCPNEAAYEQQGDGFAAVRGITGVPSAVAVNTATTIAGLVVPENAAHKEIVWSLKTAKPGAGATQLPTASVARCAGRGCL